MKIRPGRKKSAKGRKNPLKRYFGIRMSDLVQVQKGKELRDREWLFHVNVLHPDVISRMRVADIHESMKPAIIRWIHEGKIYKLKDDGPDIH